MASVCISALANEHAMFALPTVFLTAHPISVTLRITIETYSLVVAPRIKDPPSRTSLHPSAQQIMATRTGPSAKGLNSSDHEDLLINIHSRLISLTRRFDIGFASLNLVMAQIQLSLATNQATGTVVHDGSAIVVRTPSEMRSHFKSYVDNGDATRSIVIMTEDVRKGMKELLGGFEEVVGIIETLKLGDKESQESRR
ncbi:MAG: hypothetical protein Q9213_001496 [Squamulea squamosa]